MNKALIGFGVAGFAALTVTAVVAYRQVLSPPTETFFPATIESEQPSLPAFNFTPLKKPRILPEIQFTDGDGNALTLNDFRGRIVLLNIWATWCVPCRREMPTLDRLQQNLGGPDFEVVALSIDRKGLPVIRKFFDDFGLEELRIYVDKSGKATRIFGVIGIPTTLLIDRAGREAGRIIGPAEWDSPEVASLILEYLGNKSSSQEPSPSRNPKITGAIE